MWIQRCFCACTCVWVRSRLIFAHANEGVGAKITRPIFPPSQWGHYLLMFCILPPSLPLSHFLHPSLPVARVFSLISCYNFSILPAPIKAQCVYNRRRWNTGLTVVAAKINTNKCINPTMNDEYSLLKSSHPIFHGYFWCTFSDYIQCWFWMQK